ncbi:hypothetical protein QYM36_008037 [Artemia franciscana]|uniref:Calcineurin-like phosphoesterase domain-containing protein n=2 Tax=Artemia franciscana TaxID=6661 RepID=A0AA88LKS4_ARTSF|nr:hypothetical protein QYM36_008037 [Artemia franciscana]
MMLADTHLLGSRLGHWWDKLRREWQMHRSFQSAINLFHPQVIFFLGDVFDEGKWCSGEEFEYYIRRFNSLFYVPQEIRIEVVAGNHDIGFHYAVTPYLRKRFETAFNKKGVDLISIEGNHFVLVNSVAMEGDECRMCTSAERELRKLGKAFRCLKENSNCKEAQELFIDSYSPPILLQHYPLFRESDKICEGSDVALGDEKLVKFREKWDCLSREATELLLHEIQPRFVFSGHTHHGCNVTHLANISEWSVASFSWRNRNDPNFLLLTISPKSIDINKCFLPKESTVIYIYEFGIVLILFIEAWQVINKYLEKYKKSA